VDNTLPVALAKLEIHDATGVAMVNLEAALTMQAVQPVQLATPWSWVAAPVMIPVLYSALVLLMDVPRVWDSVATSSADSAWVLCQVVSVPLHRVKLVTRLVQGMELAMYPGRLTEIHPPAQAIQAATCVVLLMLKAAVHARISPDAAGVCRISEVAFLAVHVDQA
jgi:hypothetical protein